MTPPIPPDAHEVRLVDGAVDEVVGWGFLHVEQMSGGHWWIGFDTADGRLLHLNFHAKGSIRCRVEDQGPSELWAARVEERQRALIVNAPDGYGQFMRSLLEACQAELKKAREEIARLRQRQPIALTPSPHFQDGP